MVLRLLFLLPNLVLGEGFGKRDDLILEFHGMLCWLLNILISLFLDIVQAFNFQSLLCRVDGDDGAELRGHHETSVQHIQRSCNIPTHSHKSLCWVGIDCTAPVLIMVYMVWIVVGRK